MQQGPPLSRGKLYEVVHNSPGQETKVACNGILQVLEVKNVSSKDPSAKPRFKLRLGDGTYALSCMVSSQVTDMIVSGVLTQGAIVQITDFIANQVNARKMYILFSCQVLEQYGTYAQPFVYPPATELIDALNAAPQQQQQQPPPQQQQQQAHNAYNGGPPPGGYGSAPPPANGGGMYGGPPPPAANQNSYQPPAAGGMYGGPPPPMGGAGGGGGGGYGNPPPQQGGGGGGYGNPPPQQGGGGGGGMYGAPPPAQQGGGGYGGYGGPASGPPQQGGGYNQYGGGGGAGGSRPAPQYQTQGAIARDEAPPRFVPISALNPYSARWAIRGRVTSKGELRKWTNVKGEGKVFSFDMLDRDGGEIRCSSFGAEADKFFEVIEVGAIYTVTKASLVPKKPQFNSTSHQYEIRLDRSSQVERQPEDPDTAQIPSMTFNFRRITDLESAEAGTMVDVIGMVETCDPWQTITRRTGEETQKRSMVVRDDSGRSIEVTLWGALVNNPGDQIEQMVRQGAKPVLAAKGLRVGDYNGKTLSTVGSSVIRIDPMDLPAAQRLRGWYEGGGRSQAVNSLSNAGGGAGGGKADRRTTFTAIKDEHLGTSGKPDWITVSAVLDMIRVDAQAPNPSAVVYPSCPHDFNGRPCQKKMLEVGGNNWHCERCNYQTDNPTWRFLVSMSACDHTAKQSLTAFGDAGDAIFGRSAAQVRQLEMESPQEFERVTDSIRFTPFIFRLKVAEDNYNDESRIKVSIYRLERLTDFVKESGLMLQYIKALENGQPILCTGGPSGSVAAAASAAATAAAGMGGPGPSGGYGGPPQYGGGGMYSTAPQPTNPYMSGQPTHPYGAGGPGGQGPPPATPPPGRGGPGGGYGGGPQGPAGGGYTQQGGGGSGGRGGPGGGGLYGGPPPQQQPQGGPGGYQGGGGYGGGYQQGPGGPGGGGGYQQGPGGPGGGGGYQQGPGGPGGGGGYQQGPGGQGGGGGGYGGGGWNVGPPEGGPGGGAGGMYGGPPPQQQQQQNNNNNAYGGQPPRAFW